MNPHDSQDTESTATVPEPVALPPDLAARSERQPLLMVFLRHSGCPFCRQALADLQRQRGKIEANGVQIVIVHMIDDPNAAHEFFARYNLGDVPAVADPEQKLYAAFGLIRGAAGSYLGPRVWWRGLKCTLFEGHLPGKPKGDVSQLAGAFLVFRHHIVRAIRHATSADRPDYAVLSEPLTELERAAACG